MAAGYFDKCKGFIYQINIIGDLFGSLNWKKEKKSNSHLRKLPIFADFHFSREYDNLLILCMIFQ